MVAFGEGQTPLPVRPAVTLADGMISGTKPAVSGGLHADVAIVVASDNGAPVLVVADLAGVARTPISGFDNSRCTADLVFAATPAIPVDGERRARRRAGHTGAPGHCYRA